ncbi:hypothetical protein GCM10022200_01320 [Microbacterium awajiense]|uniref:Peptide chain release factor 1 n=1 Tax=Microbacterium awajiense TaxID=415214 RepID=A0ABP7A184_9MICO
MTDLTDRTDLPEILTRPGPWTTAYIDGRGDGPAADEETRLASLRDALRDAGAPDHDIDAIVSVAEGTGVPSPSTRYLLVRDGRIEVDETFAVSRHGAEQVGHDAVPRIVPLLRHRADDMRYLVVETSRDGADLRLERVGRVHPDTETEVEGQDYYLTKVRQGGWSQRRYQASAEETWKHNQSDVADAVDEIVRERHPAFIVVAGDVRARQLLLERVSGGARQLVVDVDVHTRADGADDSAIDEAIVDKLEQLARTAIADATDRAAAGDGASGAHGTADVIHALQQGQVETLLLDAALLDEDSEASVVALDDAPWLTTADAAVSGAGEVGTVPLAEGLARAAVLTGAEVMVVERDEPDGEARDPRPAQEPIAVLRWPEDDAEAR